MEAPDFGDFPMKNKIVVVSGGGSGIGFAFVKVAAASGAKVIIGDLALRDEAEKLVNSNKSVAFVKCDVTKRADLENLVRVSEQKFGDVPDIYHANAGIFEPDWSNFWSDSEQDGYKSIDINVSHNIKFTRIAIRALLGKGKKGVVVHTASVAGYTNLYPSPIYSATKHAVVGFTRSMAGASTFQGVKVVAIAPGLVKTPLWTDNPATMDRYSFADDLSITPDQVAEGIQSLVEQNKWPGGSVVEISKAGLTLVPEFVAPGAAADAKGVDIPIEGIMKAIAPIMAITERERKGERQIAVN